MNETNVVVDVSADTTQFDNAMSALNDSTKDFGRVFSSTISGAITSGKGFEDTLRSIGQKFADLALNQALKPLENIFGNLLGSPTPFNFGQRLGVMGEAGPEAIMPLKRGADGKLGVAAGENAGSSMNVVFNVTSNDASSFKRSEGQIAAMLARAVSRGQRNL